MAELMLEQPGESVPGTEVDGRGQALLVLGMHRSGTSALSGTLGLLGAGLPSSLMPASAENEKGYFESVELARVHDELLETAGTTWFSHDAIAPAWFRSHFRPQFVRRISELAGKEFGDLDLFLMKDPRVCRFVPVWTDVCERLGVAPKVVISIRNPVDVARSLAVRDTRLFAQSHLVWLRHLLEAERETRKLPRAIVGYDDLILDWRAVLDRIGRQIGIEFPRQSPRSFREVDEFLTSELRHSRTDTFDLEGRSDITDWIRLAYPALLSLRHDPYDPTALATLDDVRERFDEACAGFSSVVEHLSARLNEAARTISSQEASRREAEQTSQRLAEAEAELAMERACHAEFQGLPGRLNELETALAESSERTWNLEAQLAAAVRDREALESQLVAAHEEAAAFSTRFEEADQARSAREQQNLLLAEELAAAREAASRASELAIVAEARGEIIADLERELAEARDRGSSLEGELAARRNDLRVRDGDLHLRDTEIRQLRQQVDELQRKERALHAAALSDRAGAETRIKALRARVSELTARRATSGWVGGRLRRAVSAPDAALAERMRIVAESGMFDPEWYYAAYPDVELSGVGALEHFAAHGSREGRSPGPAFDAQAYLRAHPDAAEAGEEPFFHYFRIARSATAAAS